MNPSSSARSVSPSRKRFACGVQGHVGRRVPLKARAMLAALRGLKHGQLTLVLPHGEVLYFGESAAAPLQAHLHLHDWSVIAATMREGDIGLAQRYLDGAWDSQDLASLLQLFSANRQALEAMIYGSWWGRMIHRWTHWRHRNTREGSSRNIRAHYDLGNAFYALWLDSGMNYSAAWFEGHLQGSLAQAQSAKLRRALQQAQVQAGSRVLEIGCGWGGLAEMAATEFEANVLGVTLAREQYAWAQDRLCGAGLASRAQVALVDYRDIEAYLQAQGECNMAFDAIVSLEMFEAVGRAFWPVYFKTVRRHLKPGGRACVQSITIDDALFDRYAQGSDFIQQFIFPGGMLPSKMQFEQHARAAGLQVVAAFSLRYDYAETLRRWHKAFDAQRDAVVAQGFDDRFIRLWDFYLAYCEAAFEAGSTDVWQFTLQAPAA